MLHLKDKLRRLFVIKLRENIERARTWRFQTMFAEDKYLRDKHVQS